MAEKVDCEGNIISPLGSFKKISSVSSASEVQLSLPVSVCCSSPSTTLTTTTTVSYSTRTACTLTPASPAPVISLTGSAKPPVMGGVRGYEYVSVDDLNMIYSQAVKLKKERDLTQTENEKLKKILKSYQRKEKERQLPRSASTVKTHDNATQVDDDGAADVSSLTNGWLTMPLQLRAQSYTELQKARATITTQAKQMVDKKRENKRLTAKVATLTHDNNVAHLALQQNMSTYSSSITGSVFDSTTSDVDPEEGVTPEPAPAQSPRADLPRRDDSIQISQMLDTVDKLDKQYSPSDRYHQPNVTNLSQSRSDVIPDSLFNYELAALWMFANVPTEEEIAQYDSNLERELRPPPIYSPRLKKPIVNWARLNSFQFKNLPQPERFPVHGCSHDAKLYETADSTSYSPLKWGIGPYPFGSLHGFYTNMGVVAVPDQPLHGYRCCPGTGTWEIDARGG